MRIFKSRVSVSTALRGAACALALAALPTAAHGQSLYGVDGTSATALEVTGPPALPCLYPNGPTISGFPYVIPGPCAPPLPFLPPPGNLAGDVAVDRVNDRVFVTDGVVIGVYNAAGVMLNVMQVTPVGVQIRGLTYDAAANLLWYVDGSSVFSATPSALGSCAPAAFGSFFPLSAALGPVNDLSWSPGTGLLYCCSSLGGIAAYTPAGVLTIGPYPAWGVGGCGLSPVLTGIAVDTGASCTTPSPKLWVTDGFNVSYEFSGGLPAPPTFYSPFNCRPWPGAPTQGLDYAARAITYGTGTGPIISARGQSVLPNPNFAIRLTNGPPLGKAWLIVGGGAACPALNFFGNPWLVLPFSLTLGPFTLPASGQLLLPAPLPVPSSAFPCGVSTKLQWICRSTSNVWTTSAGLEFTTSLP